MQSEIISTLTWRPHMLPTVHDLKAYDASANRGALLRRSAYGGFTRLASRVVDVSESVRTDMQRLCGVAPERMHMVPIGISRKGLALAAAIGQPARDDFTYVASFAMHKRHVLLKLTFAIASAARFEGLMGRALLFGLVLKALFSLAIPSNFHPHYYLPVLS